MSKAAAEAYQRQKDRERERAEQLGTAGERHAHYGAGLRAARPGDIPLAGWKAVLVRTYQTVGDKDLGLMCAGVAFYGFLSLFPAVAAIVLLYGLFASPASLQAQLAALDGTVPEAVMAIVRDRLVQLVEQPASGLGLGLVISLAIALWSGSRGTNALILAIGEAYHQEDNRSFLRSAVLSLVMTLGAVLFVGVALGAIAVIPIVFAALPLPSGLERFVEWVRWPVLALAVVLAIGALYRLAPDRRDARWRWLSPGALLAAVLWLALSGLFSLYVETFADYSATFGSLAGAAVMMLWIYYSVVVFVVGAALNGQLELQTLRDTTVGPPRPPGERGAFAADHTAADVAQGPAAERPAHPRHVGDAS